MTVPTAVISDFDWNDFSGQQQIGTGAFGAVYVVEHPLHERMAVKIFKHNTREHLITAREIEQIVKYNHHANIVRFFGFVRDFTSKEKNIIGYAMEYNIDNSLYTVIYDDAISYNQSQVIKWCKQAATALAWLHSNQIIHRDVKPDNMLLSDGRKLLKLCDFGLTRKAHEQMTMGIGTEMYMAPELKTADDYGQYEDKCDVYSMGITIWETSTRQTPYCQHGEDTPSLTCISTVELRDIVQSSLKNDPVSRISMLTLLDKLRELERSFSDPPEISKRSTNQDNADPIRIKTKSSARNFKTKYTMMKTKKTTKKTNPNRLDDESGLVDLFYSNFDSFLAENRTKPAEKSVFPIEIFDPPGDENRTKVNEWGQNIQFPKNKAFDVDMHTLIEKWMWNPNDFSVVSCREGKIVIWNLTERDMNGYISKEAVYKKEENSSNGTTDTSKQSTVTCMSWNNAFGEGLAVGFSDGHVRVWDNKLAISFDVRCHEGAVRLVTWNPSGNLFLSAGRDGTVAVWNDVEVSLVQQLSFHVHKNCDVYWISSDYWVSCNVMAEMQIFKIGADAPIATYTNRENILKYDTITQLIATFDATTVRVYSLTADEPLYVWKGHSLGRFHAYSMYNTDICNIQWSPMGHILASCSGEGFVCLWDVRIGGLLFKMTRRADGHGNSSLAFSIDGTLLASAGTSRYLFIWHVQTGRLIQEYETKDNIDYLEWNEGILGLRTSISLNTPAGQLAQLNKTTLGTMVMLDVDHIEKLVTKLQWM